MKQEDILLSLIQGEGGKKFVENVENGWSSKENACDWTDILCDSTTEEVVAIELQGMGLDGTIPSELGLLSSLKVLILNDNSFIGTVPQHVLDLPQLGYINLSNNQLSGTILPLPTSKQLRNLILKNNHFSGTIPSNYFEERYEDNLIELDISYNNLKGTIPSHLGSLVSLQTLALSGNKLYGTIPDTFGKLNVKRLLLDNNLLIGTIPNNMFPHGCILKELTLHYNQLSGTIPKSLGQLKYITKSNLSLEGNKLVGTIHPTICQLPQSLTSDVVENESTNTSSSSSSSIESATAAFNPDERRRLLTADETTTSSSSSCDEILCPIQTISINGLGPCDPCPLNEYNPYLGKDGPCLSSNEGYILQLLHTATNGNEWTKENNWNTTNINKEFCTLTGVTCNKQKHVQSIILNGYGLTGTIPEELGGLLELNILNLSNNQLTGYIPSDLRFPSLDILDLGNNQLQGIVPPLLCQIDANNNDKNNNYKCDFIACPIGSYNSNGYASMNEPCIKCPSSANSDHIPQFLAQTSCEDGTLFTSSSTSTKTSSESTDTITTPGQKFVIFIVIFLGLCGFINLCMFAYRKSKERTWMISSDNDGSSDNNNESNWWNNQYTTNNNNIVEGSINSIDDKEHSNASRNLDIGPDNSTNNNEHSNTSIGFYISRSIRHIQDVGLSVISGGGGGGSTSWASSSRSNGSSSSSLREDSLSHINEWRNAATKYGRMNRQQQHQQQQQQAQRGNGGGEDVWLDVPRIT